MAGFTSYDDLIAELSANGKSYQWDFGKVAASAVQGAGTWFSLWDSVGTPGAGSNPSTTPGDTHTNVAGSINFPDQASDTKHLLSFGAVCSIAGVLMLYDRLASVSGISLASTGNKTVNSGTLPRYSGADAANVQAWLEVTTATTTTAPVVSLNSYTNESGTTGRSGGTRTFPAAATVVRSMIGPMPLQAGDKGIRSVEVGLNVATAAAAGVCNLVLLRPIAMLPVPTSVWVEKDMVLQAPSLPRLYDGASLGLAVMLNAAGTPQVWGRVGVGYG